MHEHCTELVTNLLLPSWFDLPGAVGSKFKAKDVAGTRKNNITNDRTIQFAPSSSNRSAAPVHPLNSIDVIDGDDYSDAEPEELVNRLKSSMREPHVEQLVLSEILWEPPVVQALVDLMKSKRDSTNHDCDERPYWEAVYIEFCRGQVDEAIQAILHLDNVLKLEIACGQTHHLMCIRSLSDGLRLNHTLQELCLFTVLDDDVVDCLGQGLSANTSVIKLRFVRCAIRTEDAITSLARILKVKQNLQGLSFDRCVVDYFTGKQSKGFGTILNSIVGHGNLMELLVGGQLCTGSQQALSKLLTHNNLSKLSLHNRNAISTSSASTYRDDIRWIAGPLAMNKSLQILDLSQRCLDDSGLEVLANALCQNHGGTLKEIRLHENRIGNVGVQIFASLMSQMTASLERIFLHRNQFDEVGARALLEATCKAHNIRELTIPSMGRSVSMTKYQQGINYHTMLNSGGKHVLRQIVTNNDRKKLGRSLWPLIFARAGKNLWTPYCEYQMGSLQKWKRVQQSDLMFYLLRGAAGDIIPGGKSELLTPAVVETKLRCVG